MQIDSVRFYLTKDGKPVKDPNPEILYVGSASVNGNGVGLNGIKLKWHSTKKAYFIQFPQVLGSDGVRRNVFLTITDESRRALTDAVVEAYLKAREVPEAPPDMTQA